MDNQTALQFAIEALRESFEKLSVEGHSAGRSTGCTECTRAFQIHWAIKNLEAMLEQEGTYDPFSGEMDPSEFYMLYSPQGSAPTYKHVSERSASDEAGRLIRVHGLREVFMLRPVAKFERGEAPIVTTDYRKREVHANAERANHH